MKVMTDMTVSGVTIVNGWMTTYEDHVQLRRKLAADEVVYG